MTRSKKLKNKINPDGEKAILVLDWNMFPKIVEHTLWKRFLIFTKAFTSSETYKIISLNSQIPNHKCVDLKSTDNKLSIVLTQSFRSEIKLNFDQINEIRYYTNRLTGLSFGLIDSKC